MGKIDIAAKKYFGKNETFADLFNGTVFNGEQVLKPENLFELNANQTAAPGKGKKAKGIERNRDLFKKALAAKTDGTAAYVLLGAEFQTGVDYSMPARVMLYDAMSYDRQARELMTGKPKAFPKGGQIMPVVTLVVYLSADAWDGPRDLYGMLVPMNEQLKGFVQNYKINILEPKSASKEDLAKFKSDLQNVITMLKYSKSKQLVEQELGRKDYKDMDIDAHIFLSTVMDYKVPEEKEETGNMCKAIEDMKAEARAEGKAEAQKIIDAQAAENARQAAEIAQMRALLAQHGIAVPAK